MSDRGFMFRRDQRLEPAQRAPDESPKPEHGRRERRSIWVSSALNDAGRQERGPSRKRDASPRVGQRDQVDSRHHGTR